MKKQVWFSILCVLLAVFFLWWGIRPIVSTTADVQADTVALLLDTDIGTTALQMKQGAKLAAKEQKLELITAAPDYAGSTVIRQAELLEELLAKNVKAILLVPVKGEDLSSALAAAAQQKVPVLMLGETLDTEGIACAIGDDDEAVGALAAQALLKRLSGPGRIMLITGEADDNAATRRLLGATGVLEAQEDLTILCRTTLPGQTPEELIALLSTFSGVNGILCLTNGSTEIAAKAMGRLQGNICLVGMDCGQNRTTYMENRQVDAMVLGMPYAMGYLGVQFAATALAGGKIPTLYYTESRVIDLSNMYLPENQKLAFPILQ
ncbi:MAG: substrate-binding domain-containing protein [Eubacteriales bacterium]|nr:substrate-binding domain-containing protein [Eubacteriales bacterium]